MIDSGPSVSNIQESIDEHVDFHVRANKNGLNLKAQRIVDFLQKKINLGDLKSGDIIPTTKQLIRDLGASVNSIQSARDFLKAKGVLEIYQQDPYTGGRVTRVK